VALAALETGTIDDKFSVHCSGGVSLYATTTMRREARAWHAYAAQRHRASCDVFFYTVGNKLDRQPFLLRDLVGFGRKPASTCPTKPKDGPFGTVEAAQFPDEVVCR